MLPAPNARVCTRCGGPIGTVGAPRKGKLSTGAIVGIAVAFVAVGFVAVSIVAAIAIPSLVRARAAADESAAIVTLRTINDAEVQFRSRNGRYGSFDELVRQGLLDSTWSHGMVRNRYEIRQVRVSTDGFEFSAEPFGGRAPVSGSRSFNVTEDGVIRSSDTADPPTGKSGDPVRGR